MKTMPTIFFALFLPISTGIACAIYERLVIKSGFTIGQYILINNFLYLLPFAVWCLYKGELRPSILKAPILANLGNLLLYGLLCVAISIGWWYCTQLKGVTISSALEASYPVFVLISVVIMNKRPMTLREIAGVVIVTLGMVILSME